MNIRVEKCFNKFIRCYVKIEDNLINDNDIKFWDFSEDDYFDLAEKDEIRLILEGDYSNLINKIANNGYTDILFKNCSIFIDKPNKVKSNDPIKNEFRMKIIKKGE